MYAPQYTRLYILSACLCKKSFNTFKDTDTVTALKTNLAGGGSIQCSSDDHLLELQRGFDWTEIHFTEQRYAMMSVKNLCQMAMWSNMDSISDKENVDIYIHFCLVLIFTKFYTSFIFISGCQSIQSLHLILSKIFSNFHIALRPECSS